MADTKIIRNWGYMGPTTPNRRYDTTVGQLMNGFPVGILQLWAHLPFFPGNVSNPYTYDFPVKFMEVKGSGIDNILAGDMSLVDDIVAAAKQLEIDGCRVICANCGFFGHYQRLVADQLDVPCYLSSMVQVPWALVSMKSNQKLGILTANKNTLTKSLFEACGINEEMQKRCIVYGMPLIVLGGIYGGVMTASEAAGVAIVYAIPVSIYIYKGMRWRDLGKTFRESATTTGVIMVMLGTIMVVSRILVMNNVPSLILDGLMTITNNNKYLVLLMINIFLVIIGMLMDDVSGTLLTAPILLPIGIALGISPYQMSAIMGVNLGMGNVTPPTAPFLYLGARICKVDTKSMIKPMLLILLFAYLPTLILTTYIPNLSLWLPTLIMGEI